MKAIRHEQVEIQLSMNLEEAKWLMSLIQNYPGDDADAERTFRLGISDNTVLPVTDPYFAQQKQLIPSNWLPSSANINALPEPIRQYIASLETIADPAGTVRENTILRDAIAALELQVIELTKQQSKMTKHEAKDGEIGCGGWDIVSDLLHGEKLLDSTNEAIYGLCAGTHVVVPRAIVVTEPAVLTTPEYSPLSNRELIAVYDRAYRQGHRSKTASHIAGLRAIEMEAKQGGGG